jgi:diguanylate cyclase (GGDEF)-like protein
MLTLDPRSVVVVTGLLSLVCAMLMLSMRRGQAASIHGAEIWSGGVIVMFLATALMGQRGRLSDLLTMVVANGLLWIGMASCITGLRRFAGREPLTVLLAAAGVLFVAASAWYSLLHPDYPTRLIINAFFILLFALFALRAMHSMQPRTMAVKFAIACYAIYAVIAVLRIAAVMSGIDKTRGLLEATPVQRVFLIVYGVFGLLGNIAFILIVNERLHNKLRHAAVYDALSGLFNRGAVVEMLSHELDRLLRQGGTLSILLIDIDRFKDINDRYGHVGGDRAIVDFATRASAQLRSSDLLGRYGGDEFLAVLPGANVTTALQVAERIRGCVAHINGDIPAYSVSIGVAQYRAGMKHEEMINAADRALYAAKEQGRDQSVVALATEIRAIPSEKIIAIS